MNDNELNLLPSDMGYEMISEVAIRTGDSASFCKRMLSEYNLSELSLITLRDDKDWPRFAREIGALLRFPSSVEHSFQALTDYIRDLSWLRGKHYALVVDISELRANRKLIINALDSVVVGIIEHNRDPSAKLSLVIFM